MSAASAGTQEIGLAVTATTFAIVAVFIPVAFMGGGAREWFRPFALTVATSVLVSLFISFTLDPMLSAYWGDPVGYRHQPKTGLSLRLSRFNDWFDHQADSYGHVIAWALHHRRYMAAIAGASLVGALALQFFAGGSSFLPASDVGTIAIEVRTPSSASLDYSRLKVEKRCELISGRQGRNPPIDSGHDSSPPRREPAHRSVRPAAGHGLCVPLWQPGARRCGAEERRRRGGARFEQDPPRTLDGLHLDLADDLSAAVGRPIDLVVLNRAPVDLVHRVLRDGVLLLDLDPSARIRFEVRTRNENFDLLPHLQRYRRSGGSAA